MPDLSIPSNAFPIHRPPGTRAVADIVLHKVANADFWPEDVPPVREVQYPFLDLRAFDARLRAERVFSPFHRANLYDIRTIAWLLSIQFISPDDLTKEDRDRVDEYKKGPDGRLVWHPDSEYSLSAEQKSAWVEKYQRRDAFFRRKETHDAVRLKRRFFRDKARYDWKRLPESSRPPHPYDYTRDVLGGRLREVRPPSVKLHPRGSGSRRLAKRSLFTLEEAQLLTAEMYRLYGLDPRPRFIPLLNRLNGKAAVKVPVVSSLPPSPYMLRDDVSRTIEPLLVVDADISKDGSDSKDAKALCVHAPARGAEEGCATQCPAAGETPMSSVPERQSVEQFPDKDVGVADAAALVEASTDVESEQPTAPCSVAGPSSATTDAPVPILNDALPHDTEDETTASAQVPALEASPEAKEPAFDESNYPSYNDEEVEALIEFDQEMMADIEIRESGMEQAMQDIKAKFPKTRLPSQRYRKRHSQEEVFDWFCRTANIEGIRRHRRNPKLKGDKDRFLEQKTKWEPLHSPLRRSVVLDGDEYVESYAFNHRISLDECQAHYQRRVYRSRWGAHAWQRQREEKDVGVVFPRDMRQVRADDGPLYHWMGKEKPCTLMSYVGGQSNSFVGLRVTSVGHSVVKLRANRMYTRASAGWTGQPVVTDGY